MRRSTWRLTRALPSSRASTTAPADSIHVSVHAEAKKGDAKTSAQNKSVVSLSITPAKLTADAPPAKFLAYFYGLY